MTYNNLFHKLAKNANSFLFAITLEDYYFNNFTDYFSEICETALQLAISQELLGLKEVKKLQETKATDIVTRGREKYPSMPYDAKVTMFHIQQVKDRIVRKFHNYTTKESKRQLLDALAIPDIYKSITARPGACKLELYIRPNLTKYFKENYLNL